MSQFEQCSPSLSNDKIMSVRTRSNHFVVFCIKTIGFDFLSTMLKALNRQITRLEEIYWLAVEKI